MLDAFLTTARERGIITPEQQTALNQLAREQSSVSSGEVERDAPADSERFQVYRGFNDVFVALGTLILSGTLLSALFRTEAVIIAPISLVLFWGISELVRKRRLKATGIVLCLSVMIFAGLTTAMLLSESDVGIGQIQRHLSDDIGIGRVTPLAILFSLQTAVLGLVYFLRFGLPFVLLPTALSSALFLSLLADVAVPSLSWPRLVSEWPVIWTAISLLLFAAAMGFDLRDPLRRTRNADCAFWLHMATAPVFVHGLLNQIGSFREIMRGDVDGVAAVAVGAILLILTVVALVIDRRALLVSGLIYLAATLYFLFDNLDIDPQTSVYLTPIIIGTGVIGLGLGWAPVRRAVLSLLPLGGLRERLPPAIAPPAAA